MDSTQTTSIGASTSAAVPASYNEEDQSYSGDEQSSHYRSTSPSTNQPSVAGRWTDEEHDLFLKGLQLYGKEWKKIATLVAKQHGGNVSTSSASTMNARSTRNRKRTAVLDDDDEDDDGDESVDYEREDSHGGRSGSSPLRGGYSSVAAASASSAGNDDGAADGENVSKRARLNLGFARPGTITPPHPRMAMSLQNQQRQGPGPGRPARKINKPPVPVNNTSPSDFGGVTPRVVAAATILMRPRVEQRLAQGEGTPTTRQTAEWLRQNEARAASVLAQPGMSWASAASSQNQ